MPRLPGWGWPSMWRTPARFTSCPPSAAADTSPLQVGVRRQRRQAAILDRGADGEVIQVLELFAGQGQQIMEEVVEITANARRANTGCLGLQVERLAKHSGFPEQPP